MRVLTCFCINVYLEVRNGVYVDYIVEDDYLDCINYRKLGGILLYDDAHIFPVGNEMPWVTDYLFSVHNEMVGIRV